MNAVFADTYYFLALLNRSDAGHEAAVTAAQNLHSPVVTTAWILTEVADAMADPENRMECVAFIEALRQNARFVVVPATPETFDKGWSLYRDRPDKAWSLTDCISFCTMTERAIAEALTADHHFEQAGFIALLKESMS